MHWAFIVALSAVSSPIDARRIQASQDVRRIQASQALNQERKLTAGPKESSPASENKTTSLLQKTHILGVTVPNVVFEWLKMPLFNIYIYGFLLFLWVCGCYYLLDWMIRPSNRDDKPTKVFRWQQNQPDVKPAKVVRQQHVVDGQVVYEWSQTSKEATIFLTIPGNVSKRDLDIKISSKQIRVGRRGSPCLIEGDFVNQVDKQKSRWELHSDGNLRIFLQKKIAEEWPLVLKFRSKSVETSCRLPEITEEEE